MKIAVTIVRVLVGVLFIISGLVKADDPLGLAYKMQEFFEVWTTGIAASGFFLKNAALQLFHFLNAHALALSVAMNVLEIMAGLALLIGWRKKLVLWLLLVLILFFTFLTGYAYTSGKFKNCGCFGDCLPITPLTSLLKDVFLSAAILFLLWGQRHIQPLAARRILWSVLGMGFLISAGLQWYVLLYLPLQDCLPFKKGASIPEGMKIPANAVPDSFAIRFVYSKEGKEYQFSPENLPADLASYKFVARKDALIRKGNAEPAIKGFSLTTLEGEDATQQVLNEPNAILYFFNGSKAGVADKQYFEQLYTAAWVNKKVPVYVVTMSVNKARAGLGVNALEGVNFFNIDYTVFKTAARTNPCIYLIQKGTIVQKWSGRQISKAVSFINKQ